MTASRDAGQLGFYGFRNRSAYNYDAYQIADSRSVRMPRVWEILSQAGHDVIVHGVPQTYPVTPLKGHRTMVSCFLTPSTKSQYTYPAELKPIVEQVAGGYVLDVEDFRTDDKRALLGRIREQDRQALQGRASSCHDPAVAVLHDGRDGCRSGASRILAVHGPGQSQLRGRQSTRGLDS